MYTKKADRRNFLLSAFYLMELVCYGSQNPIYISG